MGKLSLQGQLHQLLGWRTHILETLSKGNYCKTHPLQVLYHLHSAPAVEGNLTDIVFLTQAFDELFNVAVMHYVPFRGLQISLPLPNVIRHMVTAHTQVKCIFWYPKIRQDTIFIILVLWGKDQNEGRHIRGRGKV